MLPVARRARGFASDSSRSVESIDEHPHMARAGPSSSFRRSSTTRSGDDIDENPQLARMGRSSSFRRSSTTRTSIGSLPRLESRSFTTRSSNGSLPRQESQRSMLFYVDEMKSRSGDLKSSRGRSSCCSKSRSLSTDSLGSLQSPNGTSESIPFSPPSEIEINSSRVERRLMRGNSQRSFDSRESVISFDSKPPRDATKRRSAVATDLHLRALARTLSRDSSHLSQRSLMPESPQARTA
jgi:hypothetical protein